jgi:hypothetical protein
MTKSADTTSEPPDILDQLSADDALAVLRLLAQDETLASRVREVAAVYLGDDAPQGPEDAEAIAENLCFDLEQLQVEDVWDRAGRTRYGYVEPQEAAYEMAGEVIGPYIADIERYHRLGMRQEALYLCMGIVQGLYVFEHESKTQFKEWAVDMPLGYATEALEKWRREA